MKISTCWIVDAKFRIPHLAFKLNGQQVWIIHRDLETMVPSMVTNDVFVVESLVKNQCKGKPITFYLLAFYPFFLKKKLIFFSPSCK